VKVSSDFKIIFSCRSQLGWGCHKEIKRSQKHKQSTNYKKERYRHLLQERS